VLGTSGAGPGLPFHMEGRKLCDTESAKDAAEPLGGAFQILQMLSTVMGRR
jgi:hypothetical protein